MSDFPPFDPADDLPDGPPAGGDAPFGLVPFEPAPFEPAPFDPASFEPAPFDAPAFEAPAFGTPAFEAPDTSVDDFFGGGAAVAQPVMAPPPMPQAPPPMPASSGDGAAPVSGASAPGGRSARAPKTRSKETLVLGLHVTAQRVYGVLVRPTAGGYEPLRQFVRNRTEGAALGDSQALSPDALGSADFGDSADAGIQFGGGGEIDFAAEFAGIADVSDMDLGDGGAMGAPAGRIQPVVFEVKDILEECLQAGFPRPALAFTIGLPDVDYLELTVPSDKKGRAAKPKKGDKAAETPDAGVGGDKADKLIALLQKEGATVDKERVGFLPMSPRGGQRRYLAVLPAASEPVVASVEMFREQARHRTTQFRTLQAEVPLLVGLSRLTTPAEAAENTALVRVGAEDTLVLLITGGVLHHMELMQSVTAFDGPDTICSRVLLQQDVQGVGTVHNVIVMSEEREADLVQGFAAFYPEARVETMREGVARLGLVGPYGPLAPTLVEAAGAAIAGTSRKGPFESVNLLPGDLRKSKARLDLSFAWHTVVVAALLFLSVLFFVYLYVAQNNEIAAAEQQLAEFPPEALMTVPQLQSRIDSLRTRQAELTHNMGVLDSLLFGTDRWTQTLLVTTRAAAATGGIWIEEWAPGEADVAISGFATARGQVVRFAERLDGTIEEVLFKEIRERPVYQYRIRFAAPPQLPQTARVVREQAGEPLPAAPEPLAGMTGPPPPAAVPDGPPAAAP
jgi:hypothetical protein